MSRLPALAREPLVHFVCAGALLFAGYAWLHPERLARDETQRIEITPDDLRQITAAWAAQGRPAPTPEELSALVEERVREEILYREAIAMGLDQDDTIVKRRLAQKMEFLFEDVSALREPADGELAAYFAANVSRFIEPPRVSFRQLYFSPDKRGSRARDDAAAALAQLANERIESDAAAQLGDPFVLEDYYRQRSFEQLAAAFGPDFADGVFRAWGGAWSGPVESGYGWHLVYVNGYVAPRTPELSEVEADVRNAWLESQREGLKKAALAQMRERYEVVIPEDLSVNGLTIP